MTATTSGDQLVRLETKVDKIAETLNKLVVVEERQSTMSREVEDLKDQLEDMQKELRETADRLNKWIYIGQGAWGVVVAGWTFWTFLLNHSIVR